EVLNRSSDEARVQEVAALPRLNVVYVVALPGLGDDEDLDLDVIDDVLEVVEADVLPIQLVSIRAHADLRSTRRRSASARCNVVWSSQNAAMSVRHRESNRHWCVRAG